MLNRFDRQLLLCINDLKEITFFVLFSYSDCFSWSLVVDNCRLFNEFARIELVDGVTAIGTESFHWTSPNWISIGCVENCTVGCIDTGCWGMDDGIGRFVDDDVLRLLSNVNDCVVPPINSYSSVDDDVGVGVISCFCFDEEIVSLGFSWIDNDLLLGG